MEKETKPTAETAHIDNVNKQEEIGFSQNNILNLEREGTINNTFIQAELANNTEKDNEEENVLNIKNEGKINNTFIQSDLGSNNENYNKEEKSDFSQNNFQSLKNRCKIHNNFIFDILIILNHIFDR